MNSCVRLSTGFSLLCSPARQAKACTPACRRKKHIQRLQHTLTQTKKPGTFLRCRAVIDVARNSRLKLLRVLHSSTLRSQILTSFRCELHVVHRAGSTSDGLASPEAACLPVQECDWPCVYCSQCRPARSLPSWKVHRAIEASRGQSSVLRCPVCNRNIGT